MKTYPIPDRLTAERNQGDKDLASRRSDYPALLGRLPLLREVVGLLQDGHDVLVYGTDSLGREAFQLAVEHALTRDGRWALWSVDTAFPVAEADTRFGNIVTVCLDDLDPSQVAKLSAQSANPALQVLAFRRTKSKLDAFSPVPDLPRIARAKRVSLEPLSADELDELIAEQTSRGYSSVERSRTERIALMHYGAGYPHLVTALLREWEESSSYTDYFGGHSTEVLAQAQSVLCELSTPQQQLINALSELVGIDVSRLSQFFDRVETGRLFELRILGSSDGVLTMAPPFRDAARYLPTAQHFLQQARDAIADICMSHYVGAPCRDDELILAASAIATAPETREAILPAAQHQALTTGMLLMRQRGNRDQAASLARRHMTLFPDSPAPFARALGRGDVDAITTLETALAASPDGAAEATWWEFVCALDLPLLSVPSGAVEAVSRARHLSTNSDHGKFDTFLDALRTAEYIESGEMQSAQELFMHRTTAGIESDLVRARWLLIECALAAWRLDQAALRQADEKFNLLLNAARLPGDAIDNVSTLTSAEAMLLIQLCFGISSLPRSRDADGSVIRLFTSAVSRQDMPATISLLTTALLQSTTRDGEVVPRRTVQYLRSAPGTPIALWVLAKLDECAAPTGLVRKDGFQFILKSWQIMRAMTVALRKGNKEFRSALEELQNIDAVPVRIARAYLSAVDSIESGLPVSGAPMELPPSALTETSAVGALATKLWGIVHAEPSALLEAAEQLLELGAIEHASHALTCASRIDSVASSERFEHLLGQVHQRDRNLSDIVLTRREHQVAMLAAQGYSNREIARQLFLSVRTIESHMYRAMRKLLVPRKSLTVTMVSSTTVEN